MMSSVLESERNYLKRIILSLASNLEGKFAKEECVLNSFFSDPNKKVKFLEMLEDKFFFNLITDQEFINFREIIEYIDQNT